MTPIISVENLSKKYKISHLANRPRYKSLRDVVAERASNLVRFRRRSRERPEPPKTEDFWALKGINFEIQQGEVVGIIGRNGAGKSTLLKVLSRITEPTSGRIRLRGRVASLLEVGTGFHPELTGRENIFLNGAILGMSKAEIRSKFDEIVAFAGVEKFLDTPVKHYSSGMYVRLAFAVAAHLEPEILVIDEVLAVGDIEFQKKCLGKMKDVARSGRTVLFVSHNLNAIEQLCDRAILLQNGSVKMDSSDVRLVLKHYSFGDNNDRPSVWTSAMSGRNTTFEIQRFSLTDRNGTPLAMPVRNDAEMWVNIQAHIIDPHPSLAIGYAVFSEDGTLLYWTYQTDDPKGIGIFSAGGVECRAKIPSRLLNEGAYRIEAVAALHLLCWLYEPRVTAPHVYLHIAGGLSDSPYWTAKREGIIAPLVEWRIDRCQEEPLSSREAVLSA